MHIKGDLGNFVAFVVPKFFTISTAISTLLPLLKLQVHSMSDVGTSTAAANFNHRCSFRNYANKYSTTVPLTIRSVLRHCNVSAA